MNPRTGNIERNVAESEHIGPAWTGDNVDAKKVADYAYDVTAGQWRRVNTKTLGTQITASDAGIITNSVIHGLTTGGGGGYVDVKVNPSGALLVEADVTNTVLPTPLALKFDNSADPIAYKGEATAGTAASAASWRISRITSQVDGSVDIVWADGNTSFDNVWNNRASLSYS